MEWQVRPVARECCVSGKSFEPGEHIVCFIYKNKAGELLREDVKEEFMSEYTAAGEILGRWSRVIPIKENQESIDKKSITQNAEQLFLGLFYNEDDSNSIEKEVLKQILALLLERKRILKRIKGKIIDNKQYYLHSGGGEEYSVSMEDFDLLLISQVEEQVSKLIL